jgi:hypothetical protein
MADTAEVAFDMFGAGLGIVAPRPSWHTPFVRMLGRFQTETAVSNGFRLVFREDDDPQVPDAIPMTWEGDFLEKRAGRVYEADMIEVVEVVGHGFVAIDHGSARAEAVMKTGSEEAFAFTPVMNILDASLKSAGMNLLHGACLTMPNGSGALAICAPSGFGKTTTSLALARGGFGLVSDDASVIGTGADGLSIWGLPRRLKVHRKTAAMLPWIGDLPDTWNDEDEQPVTMESLRNTATVADPHPTPLAAVIMLGARSDDDHRLARLSKAEALVRIAQDNVSNSVTGVKAWNRRHFDTVAAMLRSVPVLELRAGPELDTLPLAVAAALSGGATD